MMIAVNGLNIPRVYATVDSVGSSLKQSTFVDDEALLNIMNNLSISNRLFVSESNKSADIGRYAASDLRTPEQVEYILRKYPQTSRFMGSVPYSWMKNIKKQEISECTKQIFDLFSDFAKNVSCRRCEHQSNYRKQMDESASKIENLIGQKTKIEYLQDGTIGRTYKLSIGDEKFVIKTFFKNPVGLGYYTRHGKGAEILSAVYAKHKAPKGQFADFYFGKFARKDDLDGFMVTKFIDYDSAKTSYISNRMLDDITEQPVKCGNLVNNNSVFDTVVDYGEIRKGDLENNRQYEIQRLIVQSLLSEDVDAYNEICKKYKGSDLDVVLKKLSNSFRRLTLCNYSDVESLDENEIKIVTSDKHSKIFKMISFAISNNNYDLYEDIVKKNKGKSEFEYVISLYNSDMSQEKRETFARRVRKTELERLSDMMMKVGII